MKISAGAWARARVRRAATPKRHSLRLNSACERRAAPSHQRRADKHRGTPAPQNKRSPCAFSARCARASFIAAQQFKAKHCASRLASANSGCVLGVLRCARFSGALRCKNKNQWRRRSGGKSGVWRHGETATSEDIGWRRRGRETSTEYHGGDIAKILTL